MNGLPLLVLIAALGMRHGVDPDHLAAIDGLSRFHPSRWNGVLFALSHGALVTLLAVGFGTVLAKVIEPYTVWILIAVGVANLWRLLRPSGHNHLQRRLPQFVRASPLMLGVLFGMGFETASQLAALLLAGKLNPWVLGIVFSAGMMLVDGTDGFLAARTQRLAHAGNARAMQSTRMLGALVVTSSFGLAGAEFCGYDLNRFALPLGTALFAVLIGLRAWSSLAKNALIKSPQDGKAYLGG